MNELVAWMRLEAAAAGMTIEEWFDANVVAEVGEEDEDGVVRDWKEVQS